MSDPVQNTARRPRGRPRGYDPDTALRRATGAFWRHGFAGTSLDALSDAMDMNRPSLYGAFGDKRALYLAALDRYVVESVAQMRAALSEDVPLARGLQSVYDGALALYFADAKAPLGCFLIGTAATEAAGDAAVRKKLGSGLAELTARFEARFAAARKRGEIAKSADPAFLAELASAVLFSIALRARAGASRGALRSFARSAVGFIIG
jgi:TetR/AcrR family transcriptional regulator, copper-responsive repressor